MPRCKRCNRFRFSIPQTNGYCADCAGLIEKEREERQDRPGDTEAKRAAEAGERLAERKRAEEEKYVEKST